MKTLNLEQLGVQEMDAEELKEVDGGYEPISFLVALGIGLGIAAGSQIFSDWDDFKTGITGGY